ncbi:hypothetical protein [Octadecabacter antarcticus]|nr:hypothetical protein [Octadecabacter antarcticus]
MSLCFPIKLEIALEIGVGSRKPFNERVQQAIGIGTITRSNKASTQLF